MQLFCVQQIYKRKLSYTIAFTFVVQTGIKMHQIRALCFNLH
jgi:hypothetical protein